MKQLLCFTRMFYFYERRQRQTRKKPNVIPKPIRLCLSLSLVKKLSASNEAISVSHDAAPRLREQRLTVALRPISPHCQTVVSRKRKNESTGRGGPTYLNAMLHNNSSVLGSASAVRAHKGDARRRRAAPLTVWSDPGLGFRHRRSESLNVVKMAPSVGVRNYLRKWCLPPPSPSPVAAEAIPGVLRPFQRDSVAC